MPTPSISVVMPAYNEAAYLEDAVRAVRAGLARYGAVEVVVVENGSTDATATVAASLARADPSVRVVTLGRANYGDALRAGFEAASGELVVNFDVDYYDLGFVEQALARFEQDPALAILVGSKRAPGSDDRRSVARRLVTSAFSVILRYGFALDVSDTHGMKALRRDALLRVLGECRLGGDLFDTELVLRAERAGLGVGEVPVVVEETRPSRTSIVRRGMRTVAGLVRLRVALWRER